MHRFTPSPYSVCQGTSNSTSVLCHFAKLLALALIAAALALPSAAAVLCPTVTSTVDDGITLGTLRVAISQANANACDTITFNLPKPSTINLAVPLGQLEIGSSASSPITITGPGATSLFISGQNAIPVFLIDSGVTANISGLTIENGSGPSLGGGIDNHGSLTLSNSTVTGNSAGAAGGGIYNDLGGTLTLNGSTLSNNSAPEGPGGGIFNYRGTLTLNNSTLSYNSASDGGGALASVGGTMTLTNSTVSGNSSSSGGGIFNFEGTLTLNSDTVSDNSADTTSGAAGGIYNDGGTLTITNSTFFQNRASSGGGIFNANVTSVIFPGEGTTTLSFSTFSGNSATNVGADIYNDVSSTLVMKGTILANSSSGGNCYDHNSLPSTAISNGYNLSDDGNANCPFLTATGDVNSTPAGLDPNGLRNNGGPTKTIALQTGSAAIDQVPISNCTDGPGTTGNNVTSDQRGIARPQPAGGGCDIGAYEKTIPFATFVPKLNITATQTGFNLNLAFTLGSKNSPIFPLTKPVTLTVGSYTATVPASAFKMLTNGAKSGSYVYFGPVNGAIFIAQLSPTGQNSYSLKVAESGVLPATQNPVAVTLTIGNDGSTALVTATFH